MVKGTLTLTKTRTSLILLKRTEAKTMTLNIDKDNDEDMNILRKRIMTFDYSKRLNLDEYFAQEDCRIQRRIASLSFGNRSFPGLK